MFQRWNVDGRLTELIIGLFLIMLAFSDFSNLGWLFAVAGIYLLARQFNQTRTNMEPPRRRTLARTEDVTANDTRMVTDGPSGTQIYAHALDAVRRAGLDPTQTPVLPVDLGVMAFGAGQAPALHRTRPVMDDIDYVQPFVQLRLTTRATGKIRFEFVDADGQSVFIHEDFYDLQPGLNLVSPSARLPIHDAHALHNNWTLRISADGFTLAEHSFGWAESTERVIRRHVQIDGELSNEMRHMLEDQAQERMSLDELLQEQTEDQSRQGAARR